jgi:hypothetical protein
MTKTPSPTVVALVRRRYLEGATIDLIRAESGLKSTEKVYRCIDGEYDDGSGVKPAPIARRRLCARVGDGRAALVARLWRAAERQVREVEARINAIGLQPAEREGNARTMAVVVKTLRDLAAFDAAQRKQGPESEDDDPVPRDIDEFRRELARRIRAIVEGRPPSRISDDGKC